MVDACVSVAIQAGSGVMDTGIPVAADSSIASVTTAVLTALSKVHAGGLPSRMASVTSWKSGVCQFGLSEAS